MGKWIKLASTAAVAVAVFAAVACAGQGAAAPTPTAAPPSTVAASPTPVSDDRPGRIQGVVTEAGGTPVAGVRVAIISGTASFPEIAPETDAEGRYQIAGLSPGTFQVALYDRDGENIGQESVVVSSGATATLDFSIPADATARPQPTPGTSAVSTKEPTEGLCLYAWSESRICGTGGSNATSGSRRSG